MFISLLGGSESRSLRFPILGLTSPSRIPETDAEGLSGDFQDVGQRSTGKAQWLSRLNLSSAKPSRRLLITFPEKEKICCLSPSSLWARGGNPLATCWKTYVFSNRLLMGFPPVRAQRGCPQKGDRRKSLPSAHDLVCLLPLGPVVL